VLTLKLKPGETLLIGDNIRLTIRESGMASKNVKFAIDAPRDIPITRVQPDKTPTNGHNI
jgi:sRNA-binding carbon storage regulator CsrA